MPQTPLAFVARKGTAIASGILDSVYNLMVSVGGTLSALNVTAAAVVKAAPGRLAKITIIAPGTTSGTFTINDCATVAAAAAANVVFTLPYNSALNVAGTVFNLDWPLATGLVVSAVPGAGSPIIAISYT